MNLVLKRYVCTFLWLLSLVAGAAAETHSGKVTVFDGSRMRIHGTNLMVHLYGIKVCSMKDFAHYNGVGWPCGVVSAGWLTQMTLGYEIKCFEEGTAAYAAIYGRCFLPDGEDIAKLALKNGMAIADRKKGRPVVEAYGAIEEEARQKKAGIWSSNFVIGGVLYHPESH